MQPDDAGYLLGQSKGQNLTFGFLTEGIYGVGGFQDTLWKAMQEAAQEWGVDLVCFTGGLLKVSPTYAYEYQRNSVYDLASKASVDGLILSSATLNYAISSQELDEFCRRYEDMPVVSLGIPVLDFPSIGVDNFLSAKELVNHMIDVHGYRRIAYLRGPEANQDAQERFLAYREALQEHQISLDERYIYQGRFLHEDGENAVLHWIDEQKMEVDAIIAANDGMALGVLSALQARQIRVPEDVAVAGFDDVPSSRACFPPLTTIQHPIEEMGRQAIVLLLRCLRGEPVERLCRLQTRLQIRSSCGCGFHAARGGKEGGMSSGQPGELAGLVEKIMPALECSQNQRIAVEARVVHLARTLVAAQQNPLEDEGIASVTVSLRETVEAFPHLPWQRAISILAQVRRHNPGRSNSARGRRFWQRIWEMYGEIAWLEQSYVRIQEQFDLDVDNDRIRVTSQILTTSYNLEELFDTIFRQLPLHGIRSCWISLYEEGEAEPARQSARLKLAFHNQERIEIAQGDSLYPARQLLPTSAGASGPHFPRYVAALFFREKLFGFIVVETSKLHQNLMTFLSTQISTALQGTLVIDELKRTQEKLREQANTDPLTGIYNRRMVFQLAEPVFELAKRHQRPFCVGMMDLDDFKQVNDRYGHTAGDQVLKHFTAAVGCQIRRSDIFGRFGGEEFIIIIPDTNADAACVFMDRLRESVDNQLIQVGKHSIHLSVSIGIAALIDGQSPSIDRLIHAADEALYQAKQQGKNRIMLSQDSTIEE